MYACVCLCGHVYKCVLMSVCALCMSMHECTGTCGESLACHRRRRWQEACPWFLFLVDLPVLTPLSTSMHTHSRLYMCKYTCTHLPAHIELTATHLDTDSMPSYAFVSTVLRSCTHTPSHTCMHTEMHVISQIYACTVLLYVCTRAHTGHPHVSGGLSPGGCRPARVSAP